LHAHLFLVAEDELKSDFLHLLVSVLQLNLHALMFVSLLLRSQFLLVVARDALDFVLQLHQLCLLLGNDCLKVAFHLREFVAVGLCLLHQVLDLAVFHLDLALQFADVHLFARELFEAVVFLLLQRVALELFQLELQLGLVLAGLRFMDLNLCLQAQDQLLLLDVHHGSGCQTFQF